MIDGQLINQIEEITRFVKKTHRIALPLAFGSIARGDMGEGSDLDLIYLLDESRPPHCPLYSCIKRLRYRIDLNILDWQDVERVLPEPSWQYRLIDAIPVPCTIKTKDHISNWVANLNRLLNSQESHNYRIITLAKRIEVLSARVMDSDIIIGDGAHIYLTALRFFEKLRLSCELSGTLPYAYKNPLCSLFHIGALEEFKNDWPLPPYVLEESDNILRKRWIHFRKLLDCARGIVWPAPGPIQEGYDEASLLPSTSMPKKTIIELKELFRNTGWRTNTEKTEPNAADDRIVQVKAQYNGSSLNLSQIFPRIEVEKKNTNRSRHVVFYPARKRLKTIIPTGGCRMKSCTFCQLPQLGEQSVEKDWAALIPSQESQIEEVAIYTDGSFFDERELTSLERQKAIGRIVELGASRLSVESIPKFINKNNLTETLLLCAPNMKLRVSVGIQSMNSSIRSQLLGTPISDNDIESILDLKSQHGIDLRIFLLFGKPLLSPQEDFDDVLKSIDKLKPHLSSDDLITINQLLPAKGTAIDKLKNLGLFLEPSLCLLRKLVELARKENTDLRIEPGCVAVRTCAPESNHSSRVCKPCFDWLCNTEQQLIFPEEECKQYGCFNGCINWNMMGNLGNRCRYVYNSLKL